MGTYPYGNAVTIFETFTVDGTPQDPTTVTFKLRDPLGALVEFVFGVDSEVTHPVSPYNGIVDGYYELTFVPPVAGEWVYEVVGTGNVIAQSPPGTFTVEDSGVEPTIVPPVYAGPCAPWVDAQDVLECCSADVGSDTSFLEESIDAASEFLYEASGRQYPGVCQRVVRPCRTRSCLIGDQVLSRGHLVGWDGWRWGGYDCGCRPTSRVKLAGGVRQILEVKIDGVALDPDEYFVEGGRWLIRLSPDVWPRCQTIGLPDTEPGTWSVSYRYGKEPTAGARIAAQMLACEILKSCSGAECALPNGATRVTRQGITLERSLFVKTRISRGDRTLVWSTGIGAVDTFLNSVNPNGISRRATFWSASQTNRYARPNPR